MASSECLFLVVFVKLALCCANKIRHFDPIVDVCNSLGHVEMDDLFTTVQHVAEEIDEERKANLIKAHIEMI